MQTVNFIVMEMSCGDCAGKVTRALSAVVGVGEVDVSLATGEATVQYDERVAMSGSSAFVAMNALMLKRTKLAGIRRRASSAPTVAPIPAHA